MMSYWHWLILAAVFGVVEIAVPVMVCLWLAAASLVLAALSAAVPDLSWEVQALCFSGVAILGVALGRRVLASPFARPAATTLNRRGESHVGRLVTVEAPIVAGQGRVRVDDTVWLAEGPDMPSGAQARVVAADNTKLRVEPG